MNNVKVIKLLELGVVPELLYAFQELDILSSVSELHRATTRNSKGESI